MKIPFRETKVGTWLNKNKPEIFNKLLDVAGDVFPPAKLITGLLKSSSATPEEIAEFDKLEGDYELQRLKMYNEEMANARSRELDYTKILGKKDTTLTALAFIGVIGPILILFYLLVFGFPKLDKEIALMIGTLIGYVFSEYKTIFGYFFGSSSGSKAKQETIDTLSK